MNAKNCKPTLFLVFFILAFGCKDEPRQTIEKITPAVTNSSKQVPEKPYEITPIHHASFQLILNGETFYVDPVGNVNQYKKMKPADIILLTDLHSDHLNWEVLKVISTDSTRIIAPEAVAKLHPENFQQKIDILSNNDSIEIKGIVVKAIPMYNMRKEAIQFHPKGRGNGYVLDNEKTRIYIAGDTGPIPEMRALKNIDIALIPMNLPYTMSVEDAADAVLDFKPKKVYPYHYKGSNGVSDLDMFKNLIHTNNPTIEVVQLNWYSN